MTGPAVRARTGPAPRSGAAVLGVLAALLLLMGLPESSYAATEEASEEPIAATDGVPEEVLDWFRAEARAVVLTQGAAALGLEAEALEAAALGPVRPVLVWSEGLLEGSDPEPPTEGSDRWVAPVVHEEVTVGALVVDDAGDGPVVDSVTGPGALTEALDGLDPAAGLVRDGVVGGWFAFADGEVWPLDEAARDVLAGRAPLEVYQPFLAELHAEPAVPGEPDATAVPVEEEPDRSWLPVAAVAGALVLLLAWTAVVVWVRRPMHDDDAGRPARPVVPSRGVRR